MDQEFVKTRYYNKLSFVDMSIVKESSKERIQREAKWYIEAKKISAKNTPTVLKVRLNKDKSQLTLPLIDGLNCYELLRDSTNQDDLHVIINVVKELLNFYGQYTKAAVPSDFKKMYLDKPLAAIRYFYKNYEDPFKEGQVRINGTIVERPEMLIEKAYKHIMTTQKSESYRFIHGDLTLSNMMYTPSKRLYLIDPRGIFGDTPLFGHHLYDIAKLYFSIVGNFDSFNNHKYRLERTNSAKFQYYIEPNNSIDDPEYIFWHYFNVDKRSVEFISATIWLSLAPHLQETYTQTLVSYLHGTLMLNKLVSDLEYRSII